MTVNDYLQAQIDALGRVLPIQAPLKDFIHFNPLMNYETQHFAEAVAEVHQNSGAFGYLPEQDYRQFYHAGRITKEDIFTVLEEDLGEAAQQAIFQSQDQTFRYKDVYLTILTNSIKPLSFQQMRWEIEENKILQRFMPDVPFEKREFLLEAAARNGQRNEASAISALWGSCLAVLGAQYGLPHPEELLNLPHATDIAHVWQQIRERAQLDERVPDAESLILQQARQLLLETLTQVGQQLTLRGLVKRLLKIDVMEQIQPQVIRHLGEWLDQGMAAWRDNSASSFYAYWRQSALHDLAPHLEGQGAWQDYIESLPDNPLTVIHNELLRIGVEKAAWGSYLQCLALELPGWSGMVHWRGQRAGYEGLDTPVSLVDYLAVRLVLEHLYCRRLTRQYWQIDASIHSLRGYFKHNLYEFFIRFHTYHSVLPEYLQVFCAQYLSSHATDKLEAQGQKLAHMILTWKLAPQSIIPVGEDIYYRAWQLFHLVQHLGLCATEVQRLEAAQIEAIFDIFAQVKDADAQGYRWLRAYEHHYQTDVFSAVLLNHARGKWQDRVQQRPHAQLIFCMDDREESVRRHLEEIAPRYETLGAAGVFGMPQLWKALDNPGLLKLAQPVVTAVHSFHEVVADGVGPAAQQLHTRRQRYLAGLNRLKLHTSRLNPLTGLLALPVLALFGAAELLGKTLLPVGYARWAGRVRAKFAVPLQTRVHYTASPAPDAPPPSAEHPQLGLTLDEQVEKVAAYLKLTGFTVGFARLVVLMAHRSQQANNPHILAYGCGACSGRFGGPNARAFCGMANTPLVRQRLAEKHAIELPDDCWWVAAEHDTCSDQIDWLDVDLMPASHQAEFRELQGLVGQATRLSAQERCRKFASAPRRASPERQIQHVFARSVVPNQPRAELGHQGNAVAFIGRRSMSQSVFWDRRSYLISYDPYNDPDGKQLEAQLNGNGVVGVGISLDYYFSSMQNGYLGSGNKATHNLVGLFGVMNGANSDLQTGLAKQMTELHEPMRLLVIVEAGTQVLEAIYQRHEYLRTLLDNEWVILAAKHPDKAEIHLFKPGKGFVRWNAMLHKLPVVAHSADWYAGHYEHLSPALVEVSGLEVANV